MDNLLFGHSPPATNSTANKKEKKKSSGVYSPLTVHKYLVSFIFIYSLMTLLPAYLLFFLFSWIILHCCSLLLSFSFFFLPSPSSCRLFPFLFHVLFPPFYFNSVFSYSFCPFLFFPFSFSFLFYNFSFSFFFSYSCCSYSHPSLLILRSFFFFCFFFLLFF